MQNPQFHSAATVEISLNSGGKLEVNLRQARVKATGSITFKIAPGEQKLKHFAILMQKESPFGSGEICAGGRKGVDVTRRIDGAANDPDNAGTNEYSYSYCVMASDGTDTYHMDPDVVVGPRPQ